MRLLRALVAVPLALATSCASLVPPPEVDLTGTDPDAAWARVLGRAVDDEGRIDFEGLRADPRDLDVVVAWIAARSPHTSEVGFETHEQRLAWWLNAYNALAMYNVLHSGVLPKNKARFFLWRDLVIGEERISLYALENEIIRPLGEPRIHFALNCMVVDCPRLPREPFRAADLDAQLDAAAREFFASERHVQLETDERTVRFSPILKWYSEDFLAVSESLIEYANRYRGDPIPTDWKVKYLDYDWTLNQS